MKIGDKVRVKTNHDIYPGKEGIIFLFYNNGLYAGESSKGLVILTNSDDANKVFSTFAVNIKDLDLV